MNASGRPPDKTTATSAAQVPTTSGVGSPASVAGDAAAVAVQGVGKSFGETPVLWDIDLRVEPAAMVALLGPSGCGKTTLLRIIAGLERPEAGEVRIGGATVTAPGTFVVPERRRVGMVFQDWALFPHLTVARNVAYGLPRPDRRGPRVERALAMVGLEGLGDRMPATLSGGQQQRVALARAVAPQPEVLLLDEPFSNLDASLRVQVRTEVHQLLVELGITTVFVTHDQDEAFVLGDQVAVMNGGRIVQQASPAELYRSPATPWVAGFVGDANFLAGVRGDGGGETGEVATALGGVTVQVAGGVEPPDGRDVLVLIRPEELDLNPAGGDGAADDGMSGTVELVEFYGHDTVYLVRLDGGEVLRARVGSAPAFERGDVVRCTYRGGRTMAFAVGSAGAAVEAVGAAPTTPEGSDDPES
jgi:iron(III) transport system ATP-binding protein